LVIGNDDLRSFDKLQTAANDARSVAALLESRYGFEVQLLINAAREEILVALADQTPELADIRKAGHDGGDSLFVPKN
jgi:hypothetical protein